MLSQYAILLLLPVLAFKAATPSRLQVLPFERRESRVARTLTRGSQFVEVPHFSLRPPCYETKLPEALTTPDPLFAPSLRGQKIKISFIIGTDGRVHSPLILESAGIADDHHVLRTVRTWRYRPATCNGVPTETEGKVEFFSR